MVLVEEVKEDIFAGERESDFETDSEISDDESVVSEDDFDADAETIFDRIAALKDIVPPTTRTSIVATTDSIKSWAAWALASSGQVAWWATTSALLVGLPLALAIEDEARISQQEREMQMQSAGQQQVRAPGFKPTQLTRFSSSSAAPLPPARALSRSCPLASNRPHARWRNKRTRGVVAKTRKTTTYTVFSHPLQLTPTQPTNPPTPPT